MGSQIATKKLDEKPRRYPRALREGRNTLYYRALYMDLDVKPGDAKAYSSREELNDAFTAFLGQIGMPYPTVIVESGTGGIHVYWTFGENDGTPIVIHRDDWQPLAQALVDAAKSAGLKCDNQCTTDICRLLRIPGTLNYKTNPPSPVNLIHDEGANIPLRTLRNILAPFINLKHENEPWQQQQHSDDPSFDDLYDDIAGGIRNRRPRKIDQVATVCPVIRHMLATGGASYHEPIWKQAAINIAIFCENPEKTAHRLSCGHEAYCETETAEKLKQAQKDQLEKNLGFPRCETIRSYGAAQCDACPHLKRNKSPLNAPGALSLPTIAETLKNSGGGGAIPGGLYDNCKDNIDFVNSRYVRIKQEADTNWFENMRREGWRWDGRNSYQNDRWQWLKEDSMQRDLKNVFVRRTIK
jgi:hypothetical protein